jgi:hypothetical protein
MPFVIHELFLLLKAFSCGRYGFVLCSNPDGILFSSSICLLVFDSDYRIVVDDNGTITTFDMLLCHLLIVGLPAESHLIFICSALDYGG